MAVFFLTLAPLASLYAAIGWVVWEHGHSTLRISHSSDHSSPLAMVLSDPNATLEDFWMVMFQKQAVTSTSTTESALLIRNSPPLGHWSIVIPWVISLLLGFVVPCVLVVYNHIERRRQGLGLDDDEWFSKMDRKLRRKRRLARVTRALQNHKRILTQNDFSDKPKAEDGCTLNLPKAGVRADGIEGEMREVETRCTVCLGQYIPGDSVVWSINSSCCHVFHEECISSWLSRKRRQQCPCCRRPFLNTGKKEQ